MEDARSSTSFPVRPAHFCRDVCADPVAPGAACIWLPSAARRASIPGRRSSPWLFALRVASIPRASRLNPSPGLNDLRVRDHLLGDQDHETHLLPVYVCAFLLLELLPPMKMKRRTLLGKLEMLPAQPRTSTIQEGRNRWRAIPTKDGGIRRGGEIKINPR